MVLVKVIRSDWEFQSALAASVSRFVVVKFMAGCTTIGLHFNVVSKWYPDVDFLEVDCHECKATAAANRITATPTFLFFRSGSRMDQLVRYCGTNISILDSKIKQYVDYDPFDPSVPKGYLDLTDLVDRDSCQCLNESNDRGFENCLDESDPSYLESDCDKQLLITVAFCVPVKLLSVKLRSSDFGRAPKSVKVFANPPPMDFADAERTKAMQYLELSGMQLSEDGVIPLCFGEFQNVQSVTLFVASNQGAAKTTRIDHLAFIGTPVHFT